ncbi:hypothetical protein V6Z11_D05G305200 [Gossypium hirsutum]
MEFDGEIVKFNIYGAISHRSEILNASDLELKPLPEHLKGTFLENDETIFDLEGTSPLICTNKIFLEENTKPKQEGQRRIEGTKN